MFNNDSNYNERNIHLQRLQESMYLHLCTHDAYPDKKDLYSIDPVTLQDEKQPVYICLDDFDLSTPWTPINK